MNTAQHTTRLVAFLASSLLAASAFSQTTLEWRSDAANGNWNDAGNWSDGTQSPPGSEILIFDNNVQTSMANDAPNTTRHRILFQGGASSTRTIGGSTANLFVAVGGDAPMIQNSSTGSHHLNFPIEIGTNGLVFDTVSGPLNIGETLSGSGTITKTGGGAGGIAGQPQNIAVSASNSGFTGKWVVTGGNLSINDDAALGAVPGSFVADALTLDGGSLANMTSAAGGGFASGHSFTLHANRGITLGPGGGNIRIGYSTRTVTIEGAITGVGALSLSDNATLVLTNPNNAYEGGTAVGGTTTLRIVDDGSLGKVPESFVANNVVLQGGVTLANDSSADVVIDPNRGIAISGGSRLRSSGATRSLTVESAISGSGGLTIVNDSGTVVLTGANTYSGGTTIQAGARLAIGDGGNTGSVVGNITNEGALTVNRSTDWTYSGAIAGAGTLTKTGSGALQLSGASSYTGATTVTAGSLRIASDSSLGAAPDTLVANHLVLNGGQLMNLDSDPVIAATRGIELAAAGGNLRAGWSKSLTVESVISGSGGLTIVSNSGTVILSGENTYGGATSVQSALKLEGGDNRLPVGTQLALSNASLAVLDLNGTNQTVRWLTGGGASGGSVANTGGTTSALTLNLGASGNRTFDGTIDGDIRVVVANSTRPMSKSSHARTAIPAARSSTTGICAYAKIPTWVPCPLRWIRKISSFATAASFRTMKSTFN